MSLGSSSQQETWWLGDEESPLATVSPEWSETRCAGRGKPDRWIARDASGNNLGARSSRREATKIAEDAVLINARAKDTP